MRDAAEIAASRRLGLLQKVLAWARSDQKWADLIPAIEKEIDE